MRALVLSGGGAKGAYQVGVIRYLTTQGLSWNIVAGVSVGALNGSFLSQYNQEFQEQGAKDLEALWKTIKGNRSIYRTHTLGQLGQVFEGGMFSNKPLRDMIYSNLDKEKILTSGIKLHVGAISCTTGEYKAIDETNENLHEWVIASSAFPVAFPPVKIGDDTWTDGGIGKYSPLDDVLSYEGLTEVDYIACEPILDITAIPLHIKINVYTPIQELNVKPLSFDAKKIEDLMKLGWEDAHRYFTSIPPA